MKKVLTLILSMFMLLGQLPMQGYAQEEQTGGTVEVTRLEWLKALTEAFQMSVTEDNYPDNYFSDITADSEDYYDVMLATEFGLVDVEAGEALRPNDAATREFAAHTLNLCMGYPAREGSYTFSEAGTVEYPDDIQVAIDKGWLALSGGSFLPKQGITQAEKDKMIGIAVEAVADVTIGDEKICQYQLVEGVILVPEDVEAALTGDNELTLYDSNVNVAAGDLFVVISGGFPIAYRAVTVTCVDNVTVICTENVDTEAAFVSLETQGSMRGDLSKVQAASDDVELVYIVGGTKEQNFEDGITYYSLDEVGKQEITAVVATRNVGTAEGMPVAYSDSDANNFSFISCKISNPECEWDVSIFNINPKIYLKISGDISFSANIKPDEFAGAKMDGLVKIPVGVIGYIEPSIEGKVEGAVSLGFKSRFSLGIDWSASRGMRTIKEFKKDAFTIQASAEATLGAKLAIGASLGVAKVELCSELGGKATYNVMSYSDTKAPFECKHMTAHMYASINGSASIDLIIFKGEFEFLEIPIFDEKNSPVKVVLHWEDGHPVEECSRDWDPEVGGGSGGIIGGAGSGGGIGGGVVGGAGSGSGTGSSSGKKYKYYTPIGSQYAYSGINSGTSSTGQPFTVFEYSLDKDNKATITKYNGNVAALNIPETLDGYTVVGIGQDVFKNNCRIQLVNIPDTVTEIGKWAFLGCSNLTNVALSKNLVKIGGSAFRDCVSLTSITIPKSIQETTETGGFGSEYGVFTGSSNLKNISFEEGISEIPKGLFANNSSIEEITIPDSVTAIGINAFEDCINLKKVRLSVKLNTIGRYAFLRCSSLQEIDIPDAVTTIGAYAFSECNNLARIKLSEGLTFIGQDAFRNIKALTEIRIPDSVTEIGAGAFLGCSNLSDVTLSKNLVKMGGYAFGDCDSLTSIMIPKSLKTTTSEYYYDYIYDYHYGVFIAADNLKTIIFEDGITAIPEGLFANNNSIEEIVIPDTVTMIGKNAFEECRGLKKIKLSEGLTLIGKDAFMNAKGLTEILIPDSVIEIRAGAFLGCSNLSSVTLSKNLTKIGGYAFGDCDSLMSITIPKSLKETTSEYYYAYIYDYHYGVFIASDNLKTITFEDGVTTIPIGLFANNSGIEEITIPNTVTVIEGYAFEKCTALSKIKLSEQLSSIGYYAFQGCKSLLEIDIPDTVTVMGTNTFADCTSLVRVKLPNSRNNIVDAMFKNCEKLTEVNLPDIVKTIQTDAFRNSGLTRITLPENVERIEARAFQDCVALAEVTMGSKVTAIGSYAFYNCDSLQSVNLPDSVTSIGTYSFADCEVLKKVKLSGGLTKIPAYSFNLCPSLERVVLPYRMTTIESNAFTNCTKLTELTVPRAVTDIKSNAFSYTGKMTVYGVSGTYAEQWANSVGATFVAQEVPVTALSLSESAVTVNRGATMALVVSVTPADFTDELTWKSSDTSVATVSDAGVVTARGIGEAVIQVNAGNVSASCKVTVAQPVTSISLNRTNHSMEAGDVYTLIATVYPNNANDRAVTWTSSDETIATVDETGKVSAHRKGIAVITATANGDSNVSASCNLTVINTCYQCETVEALESPHNYENNCSDVWIYTLPQASKIAVSFDSRTELENGFDFLYLYDASGQEIGYYTGTELGGQTVTLTGDTVKIKLVTDNSGNAWGYKVTKVEALAQSAGYAVSGTLKLSGDATATVELIDAQGTVTATQTVAGSTVEYRLENVPAGTYTLRVSQANGVVREYTIAVADMDVSQDTQVQLLGDVNGDGTINARDKKILYNHIEKISVLSGYLFDVGDVNGDGMINARDKKILYNHIERISPLW